MKQLPSLAFLKAQLCISDESPSGLEWLIARTNGSGRFFCRPGDAAGHLKTHREDFRWVVTVNYGGVLRHIDSARIVYALHTNTDLQDMDGLYVDHIDGDTSNNSAGNLRLATHAQNCKNRKLNANSTTGFKGVRRLRSGCFGARITVDGVRIALGSYETLEDAARAYDEASVRFHGQYGRPNALILGSAFDPNYRPVIQTEEVKASKSPKPQPNAFDGNDHKARQACVHLPKVSTQSRADVIRRGNSKV